MNDLQLWENCKDISTTDQFNNYIQFIKTFDESDSDKWVKWKSPDNQCVIGTEKYFYKIYVVHKRQLFESIIREKLAKIYREEYGLLWDIITVEKDNVLYQIERRQPLRVVQEDEIDKEVLLYNWGIILEKLEKELKFDELLSQLKLRKEFQNVEKLKLVRDNVTSCIDYAIYNDNIILLDDADWFIAMIASNGSWIDQKMAFKSVKLFNDTFYFMPLEFLDYINDDINDLLKHYGEFYNKWTLCLRMNNDTLENVNFKQMREDHLKNNIKILLSHSDKNIPEKFRIASTKLKEITNG